MFQRTKVGAAAALAVSGLALTAIPSYAQQQQLERVEITGSSIRRVDAETALPVTIITRDEIQRSGVINTEQLVQQIAAFSSLGGTQQTSGAGLSTYGTSTISLRGLDEDRTLVLVNGRRVAPFAGGGGAAVNVNSIPIAAIERVEILKDGASSIYGSDAVAGVVNFILTRDFQGVEVSATLGKPTRSGGGDSAKASVVAGFGNLAKDRFNITASVSVEKDKILFGADRDFASRGTILPFFSSGATGGGNIEGGYTPGTGVPTDLDGDGIPDETGTPQPGFGASPGAGYGNPMALAGTCAAIKMEAAPGLTTKNAPFCQYDPAMDVGLIPDRESVNFSLNGAFKLTNNLELFGDALLSKSTVTQTIQPSPLRRSFHQTDLRFAQEGVDPVLLIRPDNPNYQVAVDYLNAMQATNPAGNFAALIGQPLAFTARPFDFGGRSTKDESTQHRLVGGLRGNLLNQDWEVALADNRSKLKGKTNGGYFSQVDFARVVNAPGSDYNPWSLTQSADFLSRLAASGAEYLGPTLNAEAKSRVIDGKISGEAFALPAGPAYYAVGLQHRKEDYVLDPSPALFSGDIAGLGGAQPPIDRDRKVNAAFGELVAPIVKNLEGTLAVRTDRYNDVGSSETYKAALRWQPTRSILLRGAIGTGFRAPTLEDLWEPQSLGSSEQFDDPTTGQTDLQVNALTGGQPNLKPEKSKQKSIGVVLSPVQNLTVSLDYFDIKVRDIISQPTAQEVVSGFRNGDPAYAGLVTVDGSNSIVSIIQTLANVGDAHLKGIDLEANYRFTLGPGRMDLNLSGTYFDKYTQTTPGGVVQNKVGTVRMPDGSPVIGADEGGVVLRWKHVLSGTYFWGPWAFNLTQNFYKGYEDSLDLDGNPHGVSDQSIFDAQVAYTGIKNLRLALGARNVFDKDPPLFIPVNNQFQSGYDAFLYDARARFVYVSASYKFF